MYKTNLIRHFNNIYQIYYRRSGKWHKIRSFLLIHKLLLQNNYNSAIIVLQTLFKFSRPIALKFSYPVLSEGFLNYNKIEVKVYKK